MKDRKVHIKKDWMTEKYHQRIQKKWDKRQEKEDAKQSRSDLAANKSQTHKRCS
jgi:hypothetical protein